MIVVDCKLAEVLDNNFGCGLGPDVDHRKKFKGLFQRLVHHQEEVSHIRSNAGGPVYQQRKIVRKVTFVANLQSTL